MGDAVVVVTGAAGFIGSHVSEALGGRGERVVGVDNFDAFYGRGLKERNLAEVSRTVGSSGSGGSFEFVEMDLCDQGALEALFARVRPAGVVHLAAKAGVRPSIADPVGYARANVLATAGVQEAARKFGVERLVVASSSSVYGNNVAVPFSEAHAVDGPISPYAATKKACELMGHTHWHLTGMATAMLRFFTVFGPRQRPDLAIGKFMRSVHAGEAIAMFGDGSTSRDYTYIDDIVAGVVSAYDRIGRHGYRIWNLGGDHPIRLDALIALIGEVVGRAPVVERKAMQPGDVERTWADVSRARAELGYEPCVGVEEGLGRQWAWLRDRL